MDKKKSTPPPWSSLHETRLMISSTQKTKAMKLSKMKMKKKKTREELYAFSIEIFYILLFFLQFVWGFRHGIASLHKKLISSIRTLEQIFYILYLFLLLFCLNSHFHSIPFTQFYWRSGLISTVQHSEPALSFKIFSVNKTKDIKCERNEE